MKWKTLQSHHGIFLTGIISALEIPTLGLRREGENTLSFFLSNRVLMPFPA